MKPTVEVTFVAGTGGPDDVIDVCLTEYATLHDGTADKGTQLFSYGFQKRFHASLEARMALQNLILKCWERDRLLPRVARLQMDVKFMLNNRKKWDRDCDRLAESLKFAANFQWKDDDWFLGQRFEDYMAEYAGSVDYQIQRNTFFLDELRDKLDIISMHLKPACKITALHEPGIPGHAYTIEWELLLTSSRYDHMIEWGWRSKNAHRDGEFGMQGGLVGEKYIKMPLEEYQDLLDDKDEEKFNRAVETIMKERPFSTHT